MVQKKRRSCRERNYVDGQAWRHAHHQHQPQWKEDVELFLNAQRPRTKQRFCLGQATEIVCIPPEVDVGHEWLLRSHQVSARSRLICETLALLGLTRKRAAEQDRRMWLWHEATGGRASETSTPPG